MALRERNGVTEISESRDIDLDGKKIFDVLPHLQRIAEGLVDVTLKIDTEYSYGDSWTQQTLSGWRPATDEEVASIKRKEAAEKVSQRQRDQQDFDRLRKRRPDLFRGTLK